MHTSATGRAFKLMAFITQEHPSRSRMSQTVPKLPLPSALTLVYRPPWTVPSAGMFDRIGCRLFVAMFRTSRACCLSRRVIRRGHKCLPFFYTVPEGLVSCVAPIVKYVHTPTCCQTTA